MAVSKVTRAITALAMIAAVFPFPAGAESTGDTEATVKQAAVKPYATDRVLVKVKSFKNKQSVADKHSLKVRNGLGNSEWIVVENAGTGLDVEGLIAKLRSDADVAAVEPDYLVTAQGTPNDPSYSSQWHLKKIQADLAWDYVTGANPRTLAVIDTGVDLDHPELTGRIVAGYDFVNNDTLADDDNGHGTFVATVAAAKGNNGYGGAGVDWYAKVMPIKVLSAQGSGTVSSIITGLNWAVDHGAHVINMSIGGASYSQAFQDAINNAWNKGKVIVASAGSSATSAKSYPAGYNNVIGVAGTTQSDTLASNSSYGTWVDFGAPSQSITSSGIGGGMTTMSGTSFSAAIVSGVATMTWSAAPTMSNSALVTRLCNTADKISGTGTYWTCGRINAFRAVSGS